MVFKDRCTNEVAAAPMGGQQQSQAQPGDDRTDAAEVTGTVTS